MNIELTYEEYMCVKWAVGVQRDTLQKQRDGVPNRELDSLIDNMTDLHVKLIKLTYKQTA